ncbi:hypothetical protein PV08_10786 [Exophiala spinifera]|uniref:Uncharacterized protein n=1 Tax=Exophiala spinifera TaxID=91928 RepID=A0A0D1Y944_9EURO|nr:uncharacterized protein PV08_10786 [Exophiala spinifera]KIW11486.1 hypothetical protein PV08_10786 [Exophiala spinifera]
MLALIPFSWLSAMFLLSLVSRTQAVQNFNRRSDLQDVPPLNLTTAGWTVPLQGSETCDGIVGKQDCIDALTAPSADKHLQYLAIARGVYFYNCSAPNAAPVFEYQSTQLYNAAPLLASSMAEETFHALVPQLYDYDYGQLENSTLECMGTIGTDNNTAIVTLFDISTFEAIPLESVLAPNYPRENGRWAHSVSPGKSWEIYRVEVVGGSPPVCGREIANYEREYAAEYWFFHSEGEDLWTGVTQENVGASTKALV